MRRGEFNRIVEQAACETLTSDRRQLRCQINSVQALFAFAILVFIVKGLRLFYVQ
jgi:hypothetical protein